MELEKAKRIIKQMSQGHVYTLELEGGNFYVGHSPDVATRIAAHFLGNGAWGPMDEPPPSGARPVCCPGRYFARELHNNRAHGPARARTRSGWEVVRVGT